MVVRTKSNLIAAITCNVSGQRGRHTTHSQPEKVLGSLAYPSGNSCKAISRKPTSTATSIVIFSNPVRKKTDKFQIGLPPCAGVRNDALR